MPQPSFILSPCGTSLLTNRADGAVRKLIGEHANVKDSAHIPQRDADQLTTLVQRVRGELVGAVPQSAEDMSAELRGIIKLNAGQLNHPKDYHLLLCTDTWLGGITAGLVADWLRSQGLAAEVRRQTDLQTADMKAFQLALSDLVKWCESMVTVYRGANYRIIFNLTGGFKSVQGFLQTLATFYADESVYIFETAKDLLRIPRLPVTMDAEKSVRQNLRTFRRLSLGLSVIDSGHGIPETLLLEDAGQVALSPWGDLVWEQTKPLIYRGELCPSPSSNLRFSPIFQKSVGGLLADRLLIVNNRIDQLARYLETKGAQDQRSLDFKVLKGDPCRPSTHEIDAWRDGSAKRIFGHFEGEVFVLDKLDFPLH